MSSILEIQCIRILFYTLTVNSNDAKKSVKVLVAP